MQNITTTSQTLKNNGHKILPPDKSGKGTQYLSAEGWAGGKLRIRKHIENTVFHKIFIYGSTEQTSNAYTNYHNNYKP